MKKLVLLITLSLVIISCKNEKKESSDIDATLIRGEYILIDNAGVLKGKDFIYGVVIDEMAQKLAQKIKPLQREEYDMVPVVINGVIKDNTEDGWPQVVEIKEIVGVSEPTEALPTKIKSSDAPKETGETGHEGHNH